MVTDPAHTEGGYSPLNPVKWNVGEESEFMNRPVLIPVSERADERVDQQLDESFGGKQQTNTNVFLLQENTVLKTRRLLQEGRRDERRGQRRNDKERKERIKGEERK